MPGTNLAVRITPVVAGAALAAVNEALVRRHLPNHRLPVAAAGLAVAALAYPIARPNRTGTRATRTREWLAVATTLGIGVAASRLPDRAGRTLAATGWAAHIGFDYLHDRGPTSRLPTWYPALCAGYDLAVVGTLVAGPSRG